MYARNHKTKQAQRNGTVSVPTFLLFSTSFPCIKNV